LFLKRSEHGLRAKKERDFTFCFSSAARAPQATLREPHNITPQSCLSIASNNTNDHASLL